MGAMLGVITGPPEDISILLHTLQEKLGGRVALNVRGQGLSACGGELQGYP